MVTISMTDRQAYAVCQALRLSQRVTQDARDTLDRRGVTGDSYAILNEIINCLVSTRSDVERKLRTINEQAAKEQEYEA